MQVRQCQKGNYMAHSTQVHFVAYESINPSLKSYTEGKKSSVYLYFAKLQLLEILEHFIFSCLNTVFLPCHTVFRRSHDFYTRLKSSLFYKTRWIKGNI